MIVQIVSILKVAMALAEYHDKPLAMSHIELAMQSHGDEDGERGGDGVEGYFTFC